MRRTCLMALMPCGIAAVALANLPSQPDRQWVLDGRSGGLATIDLQSRSAFTQHVDGLDPDELLTFALGNRVFSTSWIEAPATAELFDGLGPFYSNRSCSGCHVRDGRGRPTGGESDVSRSMIAKLGPGDDDGEMPFDPVYGSQLSELAVQGIAPEGRLVVRWESIHHMYPDGSRTILRAPSYDVQETGYGPVAEGTRVSARIAPAVFGIGLLELVRDSVLLALADPQDLDRDGISGRVHWVPTADGVSRQAGRFGWKATQSTVEGQVAAALAGDMGITTPTRPNVEVSKAQSAARKRPSGGTPEIAGRTLEALSFYCRRLAVPSRRGLGDSSVVRGAHRFAEVGCASCHMPTLTTLESSEAALSCQTIHPFTDLLLHDMGQGLSDGMREGDARAAEWRTPPLWGLGLAARVNGYLFLLHDGRARSAEEAILWHDGEGRTSREAFRSLTAAERLDLLAFLESL